MGNELEVISFLIKNIKKIKLPKLGKIKKVTIIGSNNESNAHKKADVYINHKGISIKQIGPSFSFNRLQRISLYNILNFCKNERLSDVITNIDKKIDKYHKGELKNRKINWAEIFSEEEFKNILKSLMFDINPLLGESEYKAEYILEAPRIIEQVTDIRIFNFEEYFNKYKNLFKLSIRRQWIGQNSKTEHNRALHISKQKENKEWVYSDVVGKPRSGWKNGFLTEKRKTVYFLMIEKVK